MSVLVDPPMWPAHGRLWAHVISDSSLEELHCFAERVGIPARSFEGDHYDIPQERYDEVLAAGAEAVGATELARRLRDSGLRFRKRRGERPLGRVQDAFAHVPRPHVIDVIASPHEPPATAGAAAVLICAPGVILLVRNTSRSGWSAPGGKAEPGEHPRQTAVREVREELGLELDPVALEPVGYERITIAAGAAVHPWDDGDNHLAVYGVRLPEAATPRPDPTEIAEARWIDWPTAERLTGDQAFWPLLAHWRDQVG